MIGRFKPRMDILPPAQRRLGPELRPITDHGFVLYGGTAIALRLGHRTSVDFDFFSDLPLDQKAVIASLPFGKIYYWADGARLSGNDTVSEFSDAGNDFSRE